MQCAQNASFQRPTLGFTLDGLSGRDQTLFKAIVRLLDHRTLQRWVYQPERPDLRVVVDTGPLAPLAGSVADAPAPLLLTISAAPGQRAHCLGLPLRADQLEAELNSLGVERVRAFQPTAAAGGVLPPTAVRLLRWPPAGLLDTPERLRMATLMASKPTTLAGLQQRAGLPTAACAHFMAELHDAGLLAPVESVPDATTPPVAATAVAPAGLLARIRSRLGLAARPAQA